MRKLPCPGCGVHLNVNPAQNALSRYSHGKTCSGCGMIEAIYGNFITRYADNADADIGIFPIDHLLADNITA